MDALKAMNEVLDINETVEWFKDNNMGDNPKMEYCKAVELLVNYRDLLTKVMENTDLCVEHK